MSLLVERYLVIKRLRCLNTFLTHSYLLSAHFRFAISGLQDMMRALIILMLILAVAQISYASDCVPPVWIYPTETECDDKCSV